MGIDGIGNRGGAGGIGGGGNVGGAGAPTKAEPTKAFETHLDETSATGAAQQTGAAAGATSTTGVAPTEASPLSRLKAGEITVDQYVDLKVDQATAHLPPLPAGQKDALRDALRSQMTSDPALTDLLKQATGSVPQPSEE